MHDTPIDCQHASVTVVVPVRNEAAFIARTLDQLLEQDRSGIDLEIVVVDGQSTDDTPRIARDYADRHPEVRVLENPQRLSSAARNLAIANSSGGYVVIIDGHCELPTRRYFHALVEAFERSGADCLGRPQPLDVTNATPLQKAIALARSSRLGHHPESFIYADQGQFVPAKSVAVAYRREVFDKVGLFDESMDAHEDGEFNYRCDQAGLKCYLEPAITVKYFPRDSLRGLFRQMVRYGRGRVRFLRKHPRSFNIGSILPALLAFAFVGPLLCWIYPALWPFYFAAIGWYMTVVLVGSIWESIRSGNVQSLLRLPAVFFTIHTGAATGILYESLTGRRRAP